MTVATTQINVSSRESHLAEGSAPWTIHGVAIGADDVTKGSSGIKKFWPAEELQEAAESLEGRPLVVDHDNSAAGVVGRITKAGWKDGVGVIYEAELYDEDYAENVDNGLLEVSVRGYHIPVEEMDRRPEDGAKVVENIEFDNLSIVPKGAAPSNTLKMGEHSELEAAELSAALSDMESVESGWNYLDGVTIARHQQSNGNSVVIDRVEWPHFDFVLRVYKFHEEARDYTEKLGHVQLEAGEHEDVEVELYEPLEDGTHELQVHLHEHSHVEEEGGNGIGPHSQDDNPTVENMYVAVGESAELAEWTTGDWVQWGDKQGIILVGPELDDQDEPLVESYEETDDGEWYPTGEEETVSTQSLSEWDVDEDDITTAPDDDDSDDEEENSPENELDFDEGDRVSWHSGNGVVTDFVKGELLVEPYAKNGDVWTATGFEVEVHPTDAETWNVSAEYIDTRGGGVNLETEFTSGDMVTWEDGSEGEVEEVSTDESFDILPDVEPEDDDPIAKILVYEDGEPSDGNFVVAHFSELDSVEEEDTEEAENGFTEGDGVQWESSGGTAVGQVIGRKEDGCYSDEVDGNVEVCAPEDGAVLLIEVHRDGEGTGVQVAHHEETVDSWGFDGSNEEENAYTPSDGDMVEWQVDPSLFGEVVHVDYDKNIAMVTVMKQSDDGYESTGHTVTAGFEDVVPRDDADYSDEEEIALTNVQRLSSACNLERPSASMDELDEVYSDWQDVVNMTASELRRWSENPCSREASVEAASVIKRNLRLLERNKEEWELDDIKDAKRTINFIDRMGGQEPDEPSDGSHGCPSNWAISMLNWAHNPFDSLPEQPDDLDDVEPVELGRRPEGSEEPLSGKDTKDQPHRYPYCEHDCPEVDCEECAELSAEVRTPDFDGTKESTSWSGHSLSDFTSEDWDDLSESEQRDIAGHFLVSRSGWPPETFGDLAFEVVDTDGSLDLQGLRAAKTRVGSAGDDIPKAELRDTIDRLANDNFDVEWNDEEENSMKTGDVPMRDEVQRGSNKPSKKVVKRYLYEKGKADGMYDEMSPLRGDSENEYDDEDEDMDEEDDEELSYGELSSREYEHEEIDAYENGYKDGRKRASEMEDPEYEDEEMREAYSKGAHDGMDPDEPDNAAEAGAHMPDEEQAAYADGHEVGRKEAQNNELPFEPGNGDEEEEDEELAEDMYESEEDAEAASEDLPEPCESGTAHYHEDDDMYMPCASHEQYQEAVEGEEASAYPCTKNGGDARDSDDLREVKVAESKAGLAVLSDNRIMTNTAELEDYDNPVVMEQGEFEELQSMNENIEELRARTDILDSVERELVEELADSDEPLVIEEARFEELEQEAEHVKGLYAEELAEQVGVFSKEELMDKNTLEELREKYEEVGGDIEEELTANPQGGDPTEDELSEGDDTGTQETEELAEEKRNDLREKLGLGGN